jgi:hypothetical protein
MIPQLKDDFGRPYCDLTALECVTFWSPHLKSLAQPDSPLFRLPPEIRCLIFCAVWLDAVHIFAPQGTGPYSVNAFACWPCCRDTAATYLGSDD